ncbi:MAG: hypothetical protein HY073_02840 [Deltaproteobacteria bacterium]|nr:hypothetical protein [Deltaproteobacteria bacterium]
MKKRIFFLFLLSLGLFSQGCFITDEMVKMVTVFDFTSLTKNSLTPSNVILKISASDMTTITQSVDVTSTNSVSLSANVPVGSNRLFEVTATIANDTTIGYYGHATTDVTSAGGNVPITLEYLNFALDPTGDNINSGPDISSITILKDNMSTADTSDDLIEVTVAFASPVSSSNFGIIFELDTDDDASTGKTETITEMLRGTLTNAFKTGSEIYFTAQTDSGGSFSGEVFDASDQSIPITSSSIVSFSSNQVLVFIVDAADFDKLVDPNEIGGINVLVGTVSQTGSLTPPSFTGFTPSDLMVGTEPTGKIHYDLNFDSSKL